MLSSALETVLPTCQTAKVREDVALGMDTALSCILSMPLGRRKMGGRLVLGALSRRSLSVPGRRTSGDQSEHRLALKNIASMVRSGGVLVIDHRNYDHILSTGCAPPGKNIYYKVGPLGEGPPREGGVVPGSRSHR